MFKKITVMILATLVSIGSIAKSSNETESQRQSKALADAVKREFTEIIKIDTEELLKESLENKTITVMSYNEKNMFIKKFIEDVCAVESKKCPDVYYTTKENVVAAAMYPTGFMLINENIHEYLDENAIKFIVAHELGHWFLNHSQEKMEVVSTSLVDSGMLVEAEKMVYLLALITGVVEFQRKVEGQADQYAFQLLKKLNLEFNCNTTFEKLLNGKKEYTELHNSFKDRCLLK